MRAFCLIVSFEKVTTGACPLVCQRIRFQTRYTLYSLILGPRDTKCTIFRYYNDQRGFEKAAMIPHVEEGDNNLPPTGPGWVCCASNCPLDIEFDTWYQFEKELEALDPVQPTIVRICMCFDAAACLAF